MKFTQGYWMIKQNYIMSYATHAVRVNKTDKAMSLREFSATDAAAKVLDGISARQQAILSTLDEQGVKYEHYPFDPDANMDKTQPITSTERVITLYPHLLTCFYDYEIRNVSNLENSVQMCASLSGMASELTFSSEELGRELVTIPFPATPDMSTRRILGNFVTWGHHELNPQPHYLILYVWMKGEPRGWYFTFDVTAQVHAAPDRHYVHLVVDNLDLPVIINPGDEGEDAFEPSVDDWFQENHVVPM